MYRIASRWAMTTPVEVPLTGEGIHDLDAMRAAVDKDTTVVYLCNPNNPTGTIVSAGDEAAFIESLPEDVLVVIDEAYHEYVTDPSYATAAAHAVERPNVIVLRTFSKVFALAGQRVGYGIADPETVTELRKAQPPFTVTDVAQAAAAASLEDGAELQRRVEANAAARHHLLGVLEERGLPHTRSHANFVYLETPHPARIAAEMFTAQGVIVRPTSGHWVRVTIGNEAENRRFVSALDHVTSVGAAAEGWSR